MSILPTYWSFFQNTPTNCSSKFNLYTLTFFCVHACGGQRTGCWCHFYLTPMWALGMNSTQAVWWKCLYTLSHCADGNFFKYWSSNSGPFACHENALLLRNLILIYNILDFVLLLLSFVLLYIYIKLGLQSKFQANQSYILRPCLKGEKVLLLLVWFWWCW